MENPTAEVDKLPYEAPEIVEFGLAAELTKGCGNQKMDSINGHRQGKGGCPALPTP